MPELPEVENVRIGLEKQVAGCKIEHVKVLWGNIISDPSVSEFEEKLQGEKIWGVDRRGKFLLFRLSNWSLLSHLRMEGKYILTARSTPLTAHTHVVFQLDDGRDLRYLDVRKFGRMSLIPIGEEWMNPSLQKLGPEPTKETLNQVELLKKLKKHKKTVKAVLLDQSTVAGIGNIYADEILYQAGILPTRPSNSLNEEEGIRLYEAIVQKMEQAVQAGGTTIRTYQNSFGEDGSFQNQLVVYGKNGTPCPKCGEIIQKTKVAQRGTHFCIKCQK